MLDGSFFYIPWQGSNKGHQIIYLQSYPTQALIWTPRSIGFLDGILGLVEAGLPTLLGFQTPTSYDAFQFALMCRSNVSFFRFRDLMHRDFCLKVTSVSHYDCANFNPVIYLMRSATRQGARS
jgi:hypothetical protein